MRQIASGKGADPAQPEHRPEIAAHDPECAKIEPTGSRPGDPLAGPQAEVHLAESAGSDESANPRLAAVDIGSNSVRLVVAQCLPGGQFRILDEERETPRLAKTLSTTGCLSSKAIDMTIDTLRRFQKIARGRGVEQMHVIATCAVREASNGPELCERARCELGIDVEVISAEREAELAYLSVQRSFDISDSNVVVADLGGGSMEVVFASRGHIEAIFPTRLGVIRVMEMHDATDGLFQDENPGMLHAIDCQLKDEIPERPFLPYLLIGCGGTFTSIASMMMAARSQENDSRWGYTVSRADVRHLLDRLQSMSLKQRRGYPGLNADRADIIVAGLAIVDRLMRRLQVNLLRVHDGGVRDGLLRSIAEERLQPETSLEQRDAALVRFAASCGVENRHAEHVAKLALQIFDQLLPQLNLAVEDRDLLASAARLQDVGHLISYEKHQKHSYHLILHSHLPGFRRRDLEIVANVARYHRGSRPKEKHENFRRLRPDDQQRVRVLASILRVASGLDRSHTQQVEQLQADWAPGKVVLRVHATGDSEVDLWAAQLRGTMFERTLGVTLVIQMVEATAAFEP
ncbi:MAG: Ppx/GppA phosphatase family protein [Planctomycetota bacterium]|nr:Ppx/GppA phosphatase family protein [Planctomycetota bacterium]